MSGTTNIGGGGSPGDVSFNYVPLIDVTFNLIIFFVLTSEISNANLARVIVAEPTESVASKRETITNNFITINVVSQASDKKTVDWLLAAKASTYEVDGKKVDLNDVGKLADAIKNAKAQYENPPAGTIKPTGEFSVEIRADHRLNYEDVRPVMLAIAEANVKKMNITARSEPGRK